MRDMSQKPVEADVNREFDRAGGGRAAAGTFNAPNSK